MGKKKVENKETSTQTQANTFDYLAPPPSAEVEALKKLKATSDATIPFRYAQQRRELADSYNNPLGAYTTPAVRDAMQRNAGQGLSMQEGQATAQSQTAADNSNFDRQSLIAQLTAPKFVQTGGTQTGTSTGTQTQSGGFLGDLAMGLVSGGSGIASSKFGKK